MPTRWHRTRAIVAWFFFTHLTLRVATGPLGSDGQKFFAAFVRIVADAHPRVRWKIVPMAESEASAKALVAGEADGHCEDGHRMGVGKEQRKISYGVSNILIEWVFLKSRSMCSRITSEGWFSHERLESNQGRKRYDPAFPLPC